jgi:branched-chain amino acid transport system ATP-binding protein
MPMPLLAEAITTFYGPVQALHGASVEVPGGTVVALLGRNGMGKTTLLHSIAGLVPPRGGQVSVDGQPIKGLPPERIYRQGVALMPQGHRVFPSLTVGENLEVAQRRVAGDGAWTIEEVLAYLPILGDRWKQMGGTLSGGEQQMLTLGRTLVMNGRYVLLDEPVEGLAPAMAEQFGVVIRELRDRGAGVLLVEQRLEFALGLADVVAVMSRGVEVFVGTPDELRADDDIKQRYLGV